MAATAPDSKAQPALARQLALRWRVLISVALLLHLTAVIAAPWSGPEYAGPLASMIVEPFGPYLHATYLGHGYRFFCPAPGPSHLIRYTIEMPDGGARTEVFPNLQTEKPRLFYHRHFMLSEQLNDLWVSEEPAANDPPEALAQWKARRNAFNSTARSYAMHLLECTGARRITLELVRHNLPDPQRIAHGEDLSDPRLYEVLWTNAYEAK